MPHSRRPRSWVYSALPVAALFMTGARPVAPSPKLVVLITVDQMRYDYLERYASQYKEGLARLLKGGAVYTDAFQDHANAETAPGHATIGSGREPYSTGIVLNAIGVPDSRSPLIGGGGPGASPFRFRGTTLFDWMKAKDGRSRALSVSRKDRGAILPIGKAKESVYWYAADGRFTTSKYYADTLPAWVLNFNVWKYPQRYAGKSWELMLPASEYPEPDTVMVEDMGREPAFPHKLSADSMQAARDVIAFPWMDDITVQFALAGVEALKLGKGSAPDLLAVSLSSTDAVGHRFGMGSREIHDQMLHVDHAIDAEDYAGAKEQLDRTRRPEIVADKLADKQGKLQPPTKEVGEQVKAVARAEVPTLVKYAEPVPYLQETSAELTGFAAGLGLKTEIEDWCTLVAYDPDGEERILASALYRFGGMSYGQALSVVGAGVTWTNRLAVDGSIAVVKLTPPPVTPVPRLTSLIMGGASSVKVTWTNAVAGSNYWLQCSSNLNGSNWTDLSPVTASGTTASQIDGVPDGARQRYYRVRCLSSGGTRPRITSVARLGATAVTLGYTNTVAGTSYVVQYSTNLNTLQWTSLSPVTASGTTCSAADSIPAGMAPRFYRVYGQF